jgi:HK97 family phage prohead protease
MEVRVEDNEGEAPKIVGHAAVFNQEANIGGWFREKIAPGAFKRTLKEEDNVRGLWNHDANYVLGTTKSGTVSLSEDKQGLLSEITPPETQLIRDIVLEPMRRGDIDKMSFGFQVTAEEWRDGEDGELDLRIIKEAKLFDVSPVTFPAYEGTDVAVRSHDAYKKTKDSRQCKNNKARKLQLMKMEENH